MTHFKLIAIALLTTAVAAPSAARAGAWTTAAMNHGYGAANGNLTMVNGQVTSAQYSNNSGGQSAYAGGVGTGSAEQYGQATAIGNSLNVTVIGMHNTTIIDSNQINTGNQTATAELNSH